VAEGDGAAFGMVLAARSVTQRRAIVQRAGPQLCNRLDGSSRQRALRFADVSTSLRAVSAPAPHLTLADRIAPSVRIRRATPGDLEALVALENSSFALDRLSERQLQRHLDSLSAEILVAVREYRLAGAAVLFFRRGSDTARLYSIAVAASERGNGIGEALLLAAERAAAKRGCHRLRLEVRHDNAAARRLYERRGYRHFGSYAGYYQDGHDARRYEKTL
jgi:ribosomal protein S18 acetylase RimI-like enzyme